MTGHNRFTQLAGIELPLIGGPMYPCSNPELVAAVSRAGGIGIVQPISLTHVYGYDFVEGLRYIRGLTDRPIGMNVLIESSSRRHLATMERWLDQALEEGVRFFITSLGKPDRVCTRVHAAGGRVFHDVTEVHWARKGIDCGVDGLIAVNNRAGGHAGGRSAEYLYYELSRFGLPLICAGGIGDENDFAAALRLGYDGVQIGTRLIATDECNVSAAYKDAVVRAGAEDIVLSERITGVPVSVIRTPYIERMGIRCGPLARLMSRWRTTRRLLRMFYTLRAMGRLKQASRDAGGHMEYWQAGRSVAGVRQVESVADVLQGFAAVLPVLRDDAASSAPPE